jgi:hypothetical protein
MAGRRRRMREHRRRPPRTQVSRTSWQPLALPESSRLPATFLSCGWLAGWLAPRTGYRRRDVALCLLPVRSVVLIVRWAWRFTAASVYWSTREDRFSGGVDTVTMRCADRAPTCRVLVCYRDACADTHPGWTGCSCGSATKPKHAAGPDRTVIPLPHGFAGCATCEQPLDADACHGRHQPDEPCP